MSLSSYRHFLEKILPGTNPYDFIQKPQCINTYIIYMLNRLQSMFRWNGLPDSIPQRSLELYLMIGGHCAIAEWDGVLYAFQGGLGGEPDPYYMPTIYTVANPALKMSKNYRIGEDCIVIPNDSMYAGLIPLSSRYATLLAENDLSIKLATVNSRIVSLIGAGDDRTQKSAEKYLSDIESGKQGVIAETAFLDGVRTQPYGGTGNSNTITNLIELEQYLRASWFNDLGLNANYNMKRESLNSSESQLNNDALLPLVDDMLRQREIACEKINAMFGTSISVYLNSSWEDNQDEVDAEQESLESESDSNPADDFEPEQSVPESENPENPNEREVEDE